MSSCRAKISPLCFEAKRDPAPWWTLQLYVLRASLQPSSSTRDHLNSVCLPVQILHVPVKWTFPALPSDEGRWSPGYGRPTIVAFPLALHAALFSTLFENAWIFSWEKLTEGGRRPLIRA